MERIAFLFVAVVTVTGVVAWIAPSSLGQEEAKQIIVKTIPPGYRDWKFISAAHEAGELNDIRVVIGNDIAIEAYRAGKPFPEGTIIGRVAWKMVPSDENNKTFGQAQSFVPGDAPDWYLQFMEKDTKKYAATGGWGYSNFGKDRKPLTDERTMYSCFGVCARVTPSLSRPIWYARWRRSAPQRSLRRVGEGKAPYFRGLERAAITGAS